MWLLKTRGKAPSVGGLLHCTVCTLSTFFLLLSHFVVIITVSVHLLGLSTVRFDSLCPGCDTSSCRWLSLDQNRRTASMSAADLAACLLRVVCRMQSSNFLIFFINTNHDLATNYFTAVPTLMYATNSCWDMVIALRRLIYKIMVDWGRELVMPVCD